MQKPKPRTIFSAILAVVGVTLLLGVFSIRNGLRSPFRPIETNSGAVAVIDAESEEEDITALRSKDTDSDGLSDYDELYVYDTSPYLDDSDSDGAADADEIAASTDPNCPEGQTCTITATEPDYGIEEPVTNSSTDDLVSQLATVDAATLRETLLNSGVPQETLDTVTDEQLLSYYDEILQEELTASGVTNASSTDSDLTVDDLQNLSPDTIRQFLILGGVDSATLDGVDDDTLKTIFQQAVTEAETNSGT